jgi:hypothetical protein
VGDPRAKQARKASKSPHSEGKCSLGPPHLVKILNLANDPVNHTVQTTQSERRHIVQTIQNEQDDHQGPEHANDKSKETIIEVVIE